MVQAKHAEAAEEASVARALHAMGARYDAGRGYMSLFMALWRRFGRVHRFDAGQTILRAGDHPTHFHLLTRGLVRYYYRGPGGRTFNKTFLHEGQTIGPLGAWLGGRPSPFTMQALEPTEALAIGLDIFGALYRTLPVVERVVDGVAREAFLRNEEREGVLLTCDAEGRYRWLCERQPWLVQRVPQYHLAAYLGLNAVTLSRVKRALEESAAPGAQVRAQSSSSSPKRCAR